MRPPRSAEQWAARLARVAVLAEVPPGELLPLARAAVRRSLRRGQVLWRRGDSPDAAAVVLSGRLDVARSGEGGARALLRALGPDALVGLSTLGGARHSADLVAGEQTEVLVLPGPAMRSLFAKRPELALSSLAQLGGLLASLSDEVEDRRLGVEERLAKHLAKAARGLRELRVTHEELAARIGASRENVSRALERLERRGAVKLARGRIEILRLP